MRSRRAGFPFLVAAVLLALFLLTRSNGAQHGFPSLDGAPAARVQRVVDGDTVRLAGLGSVRLIGVDTPEVYGGTVECFGPEASAFAKSLLRRGAEVRYRVGTEARDRYGRLLAYVWLRDGRLFNRMLVERGYAVTLTIPPNDQLAPRFAAAERSARDGHAGMWRRPGCAP
ncbi:MAG: micrococcal nuclease [Thermoleophilaceae bacterium]|jgi:micrococcal nuclease|nr:micrococcal nuclease [Thermoleophilaceae bacterium]